jgi:hypothetical protein
MINSRCAITHLCCQKNSAVVHSPHADFVHSHTEQYHLLEMVVHSHTEQYHLLEMVVAVPSLAFSNHLTCV